LPGRGPRPVLTAMIGRSFSHAFRASFALVFSAAVIFAGAGAQSAAAAGPPPPQVTFASPIAKSVARWDEFTGRFEPLQQVEVRPRVSGALATINFVDGQMVKEGDLLFVIDRGPIGLRSTARKRMSPRPRHRCKSPPTT
jgi:multidrug efflux pump subunit AcrA (membrane-fusion protein)